MLNFQIKIIKIDPANPDLEKIKKGASYLKEGKLVVFPTDTVYGIGVNIEDLEAVKRLFKIKERPSSKPLIIHLSDKERAKELVSNLSPLALRLMDRFWPGPLTLILPCSRSLPSFLLKGKTVALRMPDNPIALSLIRESGSLIGAPSANLSNQPPATNISQVADNIGSYVDLIIDGGPSRLKKPSTIIDLTTPSPKLIREGSISFSEVLNLEFRQIGTRIARINE